MRYVPSSPMRCARQDAILCEWRGGWLGHRSKVLPQLRHGQMCLAKDRSERTPFQGLAVKGHGDPDCWVVRVLEVVVASPDVVQREAHPFQGSD